MSGKNYLSSNPASPGLMRFLPPLVVFGVVGGFVVLSWYAYHAGTPTKDGDLLVVEADKTPIKEKPVDAGGMQFPNQDKTIFDTFSGSSSQLPKVERVLPTPEEPMAPPAATADTAGWIKENKNSASKPEQVIVPIDGAVQKHQDVMEAVKKPMAAESVASRELEAAGAAPSQDENQTTMYVAQATEGDFVPPVPQEESNKAAASAGNKTSEPVKPAPALEMVSKPAIPAKAPEKPVDKTSAATEQMDAIVGFREKVDKAAKAQLGAYRSEKEAHAAWSVIQKKHHDLLAGASPDIVKADLGEKGIYYRLQVVGFASLAEARSLCGKLAAAGQACLIPAAK